MKLAVLGQIYLHPLRDLFRVRDLHTRIDSEHMLRSRREIVTHEHHAAVVERNQALVEEPVDGGGQQKAQAASRTAGLQRPVPPGTTAAC
jgi:hypothetical protein